MQEGAVTDHRLCGGHEGEGGDKVGLQVNVVQIAVEPVCQETPNPHQLTAVVLICGKRRDTKYSL